jgi:hypothetical protein
MKKTILILAAFCATSVAIAQKNYYVQKNSNAPIIDGVADDIYTYSWSAFQNATNCIQESAACGTTIPATNCTNAMTWASIMDESYLYIFASVQDNNITSEDGVELFFSMDNDRTSKCPDSFPNIYTLNTFRISATNPNNLNIYSHSGMGSILEVAKAQITNCGYNIEFKFSFSEMDFLSKEKNLYNRQIGFDISNNNQLPSGTSKLMWNNCCADRNWIEATNFGTLTLNELITRRSNDLPTNGLGGINICTGTDKITNLVTNISLYPNPATNEANITINALQNDVVTVEVVNALSQKVYSAIQPITAGQTVHSIPTAQLKQGVYTVIISKDNSSTSKILVINK